MSRPIQVRRERAAALILEDELLRAHLTDEEAAPLLDWALAWADAAARSTSDIADDEAADAVIARELARLREHLRTLDRLIGQRERLSAEQVGLLLDQLARAIPAPDLATQKATLLVRRTDPAGAALARAIIALLPKAPK